MTITTATKTKPDSYLEGKSGRIYVARRGTVVVYLLKNGESWFKNTLAPTNIIYNGPVPQYWQNSIDFAGGFSDYFSAGMDYDTDNHRQYPAAKPINDITTEFLEKLKTRCGKTL